MTAAGPAVAKMNPVAHGLRSPAPVVPGERAEDWEVFRAGVADSLRPAGAPEAELADRLAEAFAERLHERVRKEFWAYAEQEQLDNTQLIKEQYRGIRPAPGYPACPDLESRRDLVRLLEPERIGVELSEELQLHPEQSTDALVVHHPEAKYFNAV